MVEEPNFQCFNFRRLLPGLVSLEMRPWVEDFRPPTSTWYILRSETPTFYGAAFGTAGDLPSPGDYDGDGKADLAVWRSGAQGVFYIQASTTGFDAIPWGIAGDRPTANAYVY